MAVCTTDPIPSLQQESMAKRFEGDPSRQIVWVVRNAKYDAYDKVSVSVNGIQIKMLHDTVARFALMPGSHHITALHRSSEVGKLAIDGKAGEQIFVEVHPDIGIFPLTSLCVNFQTRKDDERYWPASLFWTSK